MMNFSNLSSAQIQGMALAFVFWIWFFVLAPARAFSTGLDQDDPPLFFKMRPYKIIRALALLGLVLLGMTMAPTDLNVLGLNFGEIAAGLINGQYTGSALAVGLTILLLWVLPGMTVRGRAKRDEDAGEWKTPNLVLFRWVWLGLMLLAACGLMQMIPPFDLLETPLNLVAGACLPVAGALFYLLWWGLPAMKVAGAALDGDPLAIASLSRVRWLGAPAWLRYTLRQRGEGEHVSQGPSKLCPTCMRPIDNVEVYENLKFDACPHCSELIPPVFTIDDYITHFARRIKNLDAAKAGKAHKSGKYETDMIQRIMRATLTLAVRERGTDIHILSEGENLVIRCRVDGMLFTMLELPETLTRQIISTIKVQAQLDISERRKPQDGSFKTAIDEKKLDVRVNTSPSSSGETASLRLLYRQEVLGSLEKLGIARHNHRILADYITRPHGMILVTGPTGSGKSTTLYNALCAIADGKRNIITLEDPIEFKIEGITQMQCDASKNFGFASGLRSILRQDPDVIMVGEIRDGETAKMAIDAAMTGHLVFSTLHTIDTTTTISRLLDLGVDPHRHADALLLLVAQRLVRLNCDQCSQTYEMTGRQLDDMDLPGGPDKLILKRGAGCVHCHDTGYYEREGIYEILIPDEQIRQMIIEKASPAEVRREARRRGMRTLLEDGLSKAIIGRTTIDEVLRVTS